MSEDQLYSVDAKDQFRPKIDLGKFLSIDPNLALSNYLNYVFQHLRIDHEETIRFSQLSIFQRTLYSYYLIEGQVTNGGFVQAIYNDYTKYFSLAIDALQLIEQEKCGELIARAFEISKKKKWSFFLGRLKGLFNSNLYNENKELDNLDTQFYRHVQTNNLQFRNFIWENSPHFFSCESIPPTSEDGFIRTYIGETTLYQQYKLCSKGLDGWYQEYHPNGNLKLKSQFNNGGFTGKSEKYDPEGGIKKKTTLEDGKLAIITYRDSGQKEWLKTVDLVSRRPDGRYIHWHENGTIKVEGFNKGSKLYGPYQQFYRNGQLKMQGNHDKNNLYVNHFYLEDGTQTLKDGVGFTKEERTVDGKNRVRIDEYKNGLRNGKLEVTVDGLLESTEVYKDGNRVG